LDLIDLIDLHPNDKLIPIGDLMHKGPDEVECVRIARKVCDEYILGNHEDKQIRWERHQRLFLDTGKPNPMMHVEDYKILPEEHRNWLKSKAKLYMRIVAGGKTFLLVHGGIEPRMRGLPHLNSPWHLSKKEKGYSWNVLRTRYVNPKGGMVSLGSEDLSQDRYWAEVYDGRFGHVIFGHQPFLKRKTPREYEHATAIDLGVVYGNVLCAVIIDGDTGEVTHVTVPAHEQYAMNRTANPVPE
jgi:hypothetical protein